MKDIAVRYTYRYPDSALKYIQKALLLAKKIKSDKWTISTSNTYGTVLHVMGNYPLSLEYNFSALRIAEKLQDKELLFNIYSGLSNAYREGGDYDNAIYYAHKVRNISEKNFTNQLHNTYKLLGSIYEKFNHLDSASLYIQKSYRYLKINKRPLTWPSLPYIMGNIYAKKANYPVALNYYRTGYRFAIQDKLNTNLMEICNGLAETFAKTGQIDSGIYYSKQTLLIGQSTAYPIAIFKASSLLSDIYKAQHATDSLVKYTDLATSTKDSLFNQRKVTEVQNISFNEKLRQQEIEAREEQYKKQGSVLCAAFGTSCFYNGRYFALAK
jgi:tetratricopeptide (TPR) repeat protein